MLVNLKNIFGGFDMKKKKNRCRFCVVLLMVILALYMPKEVHAKILPKYYKELLEGCGNICIYDYSDSINKTFSYEKEIILSNLSQIEFEKTFTINESKIWSALNTIVVDYSSMVVVSDLWDISEESLTPASDITITILVPYWSEDEEAVEHIEDVAWEEILNYWTDSTVIVIYLDGFTDIYDNRKL